MGPVKPKFKTVANPTHLLIVIKNPSPWGCELFPLRNISEKLGPGLEFVEWPESHAIAGTPGRRRRTARVPKELHIYAPQKRAATSLRFHL